MITDFIKGVIIFYALMLAVMTVFIGAITSTEIMSNNKTVKDVYHLLMAYNSDKYTIFGQFVIGIIWRVFFLLIPFCIVTVIIVIVKVISKLIYKNGGRV